MRTTGSSLGRLATALVGLVAPLHGQAPPSPPTERDAQQLLATQATRESQGALRVTGFRKTDGVRRDIGGAYGYELEFEAQVSILKDLKWKTSGLIGPMARTFDGFKVAIPDAQAEKDGGYWAGFFNMTQNTGLPYRQRTQVRIVGKLVYERTENGWRVIGAEFGPGDLSTVAQTTDNPPTDAPPPAPTRPANGGLASLDVIVGSGTVGAFKHGAKVTGCYDATGLIDIVLRGTKPAKKCDRTRNLVHAGVDVAAPKGSPIRAMATGEVTEVVSSRSDPAFRTLGFAVIIKHDANLGDRETWSLYLHMDQPPHVSPTDRVQAGETVIGVVGATGAAFGPHVHLELRHFAERFSPIWRNIYGVEEPLTQGGTFDPKQFAADWSDPLQPHGGSASTAATIAATSGAGIESDVTKAAAEGIRLYNAGEYSAAARHLGIASAAGHAKAAGYLAFMHRSGNGVSQNLQKAIELFRVSAGAGEPGSAYNLATIYEEGEGVRRDTKAAEEWYRAALRGYLPLANAGDSDALTMVGRMHAEGTGTTRDVPAGVGWLRRASEAGSIRGTRLLGEILLKGDEVKRDRAEGLRLIRIAAQKGDQTAQEILRRMGQTW